MLQNWKFFSRTFAPKRKKICSSKTNIQKSLNRKFAQKTLYFQTTNRKINKKLTNNNVRNQNIIVASSQVSQYVLFSLRDLSHSSRGALENWAPVKPLEVLKVVQKSRILCVSWKSRKVKQKSSKVVKPLRLFCVNIEIFILADFCWSKKHQGIFFLKYVVGDVTISRCKCFSPKIK